MRLKESKRQWVSGHRRGLSISDLLFPRKCPICGRELLRFERHLCLGCLGELPMTYFWKYHGNSAEMALWGRTSVERVYALFYFKGRYKELLHRLKYKSDTGLGIYLGEILGEKIASSAGYAHIDYIIPVPLHWMRELRRGYNQANIIAKGIISGLRSGGDSQECRILGNILRRKRRTKSQTIKNREERLENVLEAFALTRRFKKNEREMNNPLYGKNVLIVDDVMTTGATIDACSQLLARSGCRISVATLAYVE